MATMVSATPIGHWHKIVEGFQASTKSFYDSLEHTINRRNIPDARTSTVVYRESGFGSATREYLRIQRGPYVFDICAAPFGTGYFFSWWLAESRPSPVGPTILAILAIVLLWFLTSLWTFVILLIVAFFLLGLAISQGESQFAENLLVIPLLGWFWQRLFVALTYYRLDTRQMFMDSVHSAVLEVIDGLLDAQNLPRFTEDERKPIMREFFQK